MDWRDGFSAAAESLGLPEAWGIGGGNGGRIGVEDEEAERGMQSEVGLAIGVGYYCRLRIINW